MKTTEESALQKPRLRDRAKTKMALQRAIRMFERKGLPLSITAIASEVGVTPALIHNTYPGIADEIRLKTGRTAREQRDAKAEELNIARDKIRDLTEKLKDSNAEKARLASINETLRDEIAALRGQLTGKVTVISKV
jgi:AcrR family transcriptional regulator